MRLALQRGIAVVSVGCESDFPASGHEAGRQSAAAGRLLAICQRLGLSATWALRNPRQSPLGASRAGLEQHEIALLAATASGSSLAEFTRELIRGVSAVGALGAPLSTLFVREAVMPGALEVMAKYGIGAICTVSSALRKPASPRRLRYGIDEFVADATLPRGGRSWFGGDARAIDRLHKAAAEQHGLFHLAIDVASIARAPNRRLRLTERVLSSLAQMVRAGQLETATISAAAARLASRHNASPAQSILRRAA